MPSLKQCYRIHQRYSGQICAAIGVLSRGILFHTAVVHGHESVPVSPLWVSSPLEKQPSQGSAVERTPLCPRSELLLAHILERLAGFFSDWIHPKVSECTHSSLLNPVYSQEKRSCYKFSLVEKNCCARITVLFLKLLRKYFLLILALTGQQSDYTNLFYQEARQEW